MATKTIWDLLLEPLEASIYIKTNAGLQPLKLICPTRDDVEALQKTLGAEPLPPIKETEVVEGKKKTKKKETDETDTDYLKSLEDREIRFGLGLMDLGLKEKPDGTLDERMGIYKKFPNPVLQQIVIAINYLLAHEIPPSGKPDEDLLV
jgi:hypothetical protein